MSADTLLSRLDGVRRAGRGAWRAKCHAHAGDNRTALSIRETDDGAILLHCHAYGCSVDAIAGAVGVELSDLFPSREMLAGAFAKKGISKPWRASDVIAALKHEATVAVVILQDVEKGIAISEVDRVRAGTAAAYMVLFIGELEYAH